MKIDTASVRVMRSYDYSHFEVCLSSTEATTPELTDELRKMAARLADKAVLQFQIAKTNAMKVANEKQAYEWELQNIERIRNTPEGERTVDEVAQLKAWSDKAFAARHYDYQDDWNED